MRVVARRHRSTAHGRADAHVALAPGFAQFHIGMLGVADLTDGGITHLANQANFAGGQAHLGIFAFFGQQLGRAARAADQLTALAGLQLDVMNGRTNRDTRQWQCSCPTRISACGARNNGIADLQADRGDHIAFFTVDIV